jgi:hypothetical protein
VPEGMSVEIAHKLTEREEAAAERYGRWHEVLEIVEVALLAIVAVATAWSGLQAARWDGRQALLYGQSSDLRFASDAASTLGGQKLSADAAGFNTWLQAHRANDTTLMNEIADRFTPDYKAAFDAWLKTDPFNNPKAPPGPGYMPGYVNPDFAKAARLNKEASARFDAGTRAQETGEKYVRNTVLFASVLFLVALAQRQKAHGARLAATGIAVALPVFTMASTVTLPRL